MPKGNPIRVGEIFDRLRVTERIDSEWVMCVCACGKSKKARRGELSASRRTKRPISCGCYRAALLREHSFLHGKIGTPAHQSWKSMLNRCRNRADYAGVKVCARWLDFRFFLADMGERPERHTLDRIDNSKGYEPSNCHWATMEQQQRNKTSNHLVTAFGETKPIVAWAEKLGAKASALYIRLTRLRWDPERAVSTPIRPKAPNGTAKRAT